MKEKDQASPFALALSEAQVLWEEHAQRFGLAKEMSDPHNLHGAFLDGFLHARGWRLDETKAPAHHYKDERAYELYPHPLNEIEEIRKIVNTVYDPKAIVDAVWSLNEKFKAASQAFKSIQEVNAQPVPMLLWCPECGTRHIDVPPFDTKVHHTHACQHCGMVWRPAICATKGVSFLPGFKND
jgi:hypothetical protein